MDSNTSGIVPIEKEERKRQDNEEEEEPKAVAGTVLHRFAELLVALPNVFGALHALASHAGDVGRLWGKLFKLEGDTKGEVGVESRIQ